MDNDRDLDEARRQLAGATAAQALAWAGARFGDSAAIASSFGVEDVILIDLAAGHAPPMRVFTLDTGRLPTVTYELMAAIRSRYWISVVTLFYVWHTLVALGRVPGMLTVE